MSVASPSLKERLQAVKKTRWIRFGVAAVLFILFAVWLIITISCLSLSLWPIFI